MKSASVALILVAASCSGLALDEASARRKAETSMLFGARSTAGLEALEAGASSSHPSHASRRPVSDLIVRLKPWGEGTLASALDPSVAERRSRDAALFAAELIIVAAGRIQIEERAACGPWAGDTALCRTECDGGAFALVRRGSGGKSDFSLRVGKAAAIVDGGFGDVVRLGACSDEVVAGGIAARTGSAFVEIHLDRR